MQKVIHHSSHTERWLTYVRYPPGFVCNGCRQEIVHGCGYRCAACNFNLHECCATPPPGLHQSFHGGNGNSLQFQTMPPVGISERQCSECAGTVSGFRYYCTTTSCAYALHPTCALLPRSLHPQLETIPPRPAHDVQTSPIGPADVQTALDPQPDSKPQDENHRPSSAGRMTLRCGKFAIKVALGVITGNPMTIGGAVFELVTPN